MAWRLYRVTYELQSPLHIGYHKIGNVQRTRYYVPARNIWGAVTEKLTRSGFTAPGAQEKNYLEIGKWVRTHCVFSYWFLRSSEGFLFPNIQHDGVQYGSLKEGDFERRYLSAHVTTALDPATTSAETESLHEIEVLVANGGAGKLSLTGWIFLDDEAITRLEGEQKWSRWLGELQVGGERRYGFGQLRIRKEAWRSQDNGQIFDGYTARCEKDRPQVEVRGEKPFLAHTLAQGVSASGSIEPLVGRETDGSDRFGRRLTSAKVCWVPGSICETTLWFEFTPEGIWKKAAT